MLPVLALTGSHAAGTNQQGPPLGFMTEADILATTDWTIVPRTWRFKGICVCGSLIPRFGIRTENAYPTGVVEAVKQPGASYLKTVVSATTKAATTSGIKLAASTLGPGVFSSGHSGKGMGEDGMQFLDAHVYSFPGLGHPAVAMMPGVCLPYAPAGPMMTPHYYSELDALAWRTGTGDLLDFASALSYYAGTYGACAASIIPGFGSLSGAFCAGTWGPIYPRRGFVTQHSEVIAAHLIAVRALRVALLPTGRVITQPYFYPTLQGHYIQMLKPFWRPAYQIGQGIGTTEAGTTSIRGGYLFIHMPIMECCSPCYPSRPVGPRSINNPL
ncbi:TraU family protein [bacterium AH-315-F18]|nr:TraU family protein [bacterium AH-315-F18]